MSPSSTDSEFNVHHPQPLLIVISGPSGAGKDTVMQRMQERGLPFHFVVTATTRPKRVNETHGKDYFFVSKEEFARMIDEDELIEHAIDVGKGILHWKLRNDRRVVVMEQTNVRFVESLPEQVSLVTVDASFISLKIILPVVKKWMLPSPPSPLPTGEGRRGEGNIVALIKPQFEAGKKDVSRGDGVIRDPEIHKQVLLDVLSFAQQEGFQICGLIKSPLLGPKGNAEFLVWLDQTQVGEGSEEIDQMVAKVLGKS